MKLSEIQRYHYQCEYSTHEGDYGSSIDPDGDGEWVKFTDAQAKSLADERRIQQLEDAVRLAIVACNSEHGSKWDNLYCKLDAALRVGDAT